jgi:hypothetical protein
MNKYFSGLALTLAFTASSAFADFDSDKSMICSLGDFDECTAAGCQPVTAADINAPRLLRVDSRKKTVETISGGSGQVSKLDNVESINSKLILQGAVDGVENRLDGLGYTLTINKTSGSLAFAGATDDAVFAAFGACVND